MPRTIPWKDEKELITILQHERDAVDQQIAALMQTRDLNDQSGRLVVLLCQYLVMGSAKKATDWATSLGWRLDSCNRGEQSTRDWQPKDLYAAIQNGTADAPPGLLLICKRVFFANQDKQSG